MEPFNLIRPFRCFCRNCVTSQGSSTGDGVDHVDGHEERDDGSDAEQQHEHLPERVRLGVVPAASPATGSTI